MAAVTHFKSPQVASIQEVSSPRLPAWHPTPAWFLAAALALTLTACSSGSDDDSASSAETTIAITATVNVDAGTSVLIQQQYSSFSNGSGIGAIITADATSAQPDNGYLASTVDIVNSVSNSSVETLDFAANGLANGATAAQLAAFFDMQNSSIDATASTRVRLTLSSATVAPGDQFTVNGVNISGNTRSEVMLDINSLPDITASIDGSGVISVIATDGHDLRFNLANAASGQTVAIESFHNDGDSDISIDSATIGDGQSAIKATIGGMVSLTLDYPLQLANAGSGNIFGATLVNTYSEQNGFDASAADTYNHASSINLTDNLGNDHEMTQYFVRSDDMGGLFPNRWVLYVLIDGRHVGAPDTIGEPQPAAFELVFDTNGQLDATLTDRIEINSWIPRDDNGNANGAATARITIDITGSTQIGGAFTLTNVSIN